MARRSHRCRRGGMTLSEGHTALLWAIAASPTLLVGLATCAYLFRAKRRAGFATSLVTTLGALCRVVWCAIRPFEDEDTWSEAEIIALRVVNRLSIVCVAAWAP